MTDTQVIQIASTCCGLLLNGTSLRERIYLTIAAGVSSGWGELLTIVIMADNRIVIPAKAGIQERTGARSLPSGYSRLRGNDGSGLKSRYHAIDIVMTFLHEICD